MVEPFYVMKVLERAKELEREGKKIIHFEVGEPDLPVPEIVKKKALEVLKRTELRYTEAAGIPPLREKIAEYYQETYGVKVSPEQIIVTPGSSIGLLAVLKVVSERIGNVAYPDPGYPCYKNMLRFLKAESKPVYVNPEENFKIKPEKLSTQAVVINSPSNPVGTVYTKEELKRISQKAFVISDEIYHGLTYEERAPSILEVTDNAAVISGFSKFFLMTGWRVGWLIAPKSLVKDIVAILQNIAISAPTLSQITALVCFEKECLEELRENVKTFKKRRNLMLSGLKEIGFNVPVEPKGAFYIFADVSNFTEDSFRFAFEVLEKTGVAITPGKDFGYNKTRCFVRFSFCTDERNIEEGLERLRKFLG